LLTPDFVKLSHNGASDAQASVYLWVGVAICTQTINIHLNQTDRQTDRQT